MVKRIGSSRRKTRYLFTNPKRKKGKLSLTKYLLHYQEGDRVVLKGEPSRVHEGLYFPRFHGKMGVISTKKGSCYHVLIKDGKKEKTLIVHPVHMRKL
ncbi:50S ribosomal protein L21e [Candidatus Woesearchaeota archaeon]|nr:50S ribosomal protein L21e [Candidatus Woesearchaeota archaeon]